MQNNKQAVDELVRLSEKLQSKRDRLKGEFEDVQKKLEAVTTTLNMMGHLGTNVDLTGKTQLEALVAIARGNNNLLEVPKAKRYMLRVGYFKGTENASSIIHTAITRSGRFAHLKRGIYSLLPETNGTKQPEANTQSLLPELSPSH